MYKFTRPVEKLTVLVKRGYRVPLPSGLVDWPVGRRVYWRSEAGEVIVELRPRCFHPPRYITSRIRKSVFVKRPSWRNE